MDLRRPIRVEKRAFGGLGTVLACQNSQKHRENKGEARWGKKKKGRRVSWWKEGKSDLSLGHRASGEVSLKLKGVETQVNLLWEALRADVRASFVTELSTHREDLFDR